MNFYQRSFNIHSDCSLNLFTADLNTFNNFSLFYEAWFKNILSNSIKLRGSSVFTVSTVLFELKMLIAKFANLYPAKVILFLEVS